MNTKFLSTTILLILLLIPACSDDDTNETPNPGNAIPVTTTTMETWFNTNQDLPQALSAVFTAMMAQLHGTPDDSITWTTNGAGLYEGTAGIDMDMDGTDDLTLHGTATLTEINFTKTSVEYDGNYTIDGITGYPINIVGYGEVIIMGGTDIPTMFAFHPGIFTITHTDGSEIQITEMGVQLDITFPAAPYLSGFICFRAVGGGSELEGELLFIPNGMGGWMMEVEGDGWGFSIL